jgi:hypothetical protein
MPLPAAERGVPPEEADGDTACGKADDMASGEADDDMACRMERAGVRTMAGAGL